MNKLERIKAIKEELAILEEEFLEEGEPKQEFEYPIYKQSIEGKQIVKFTGLKEGTIVYKGMYRHDVGYTYSEWAPHTNANIWKDIIFDKERGLYDKQLVWCWDDFYTHLKALRFYDAKNKKTYSYKGIRKSSSWQHYEPYEGDYPEWAKIAYETLED